MDSWVEMKLLDTKGNTQTSYEVKQIGNMYAM